MSTNSVPSGPTKVVATNVAADWLREHDRSVAAAAWDECMSAIDSACQATHSGMVENPYANALVTDERTEK